MRISPKFILIITIAIAVVATGLLIYNNMNEQEEEVEVIEEPEYDFSLENNVIIIDAGHGGFDDGTTGVSTGRAEKEVNLEIAYKLKEELETEGFEIVMTRETDDAIAETKEEDMAKREQIILDTVPYLFISIHQNFYEGGESAYGPQVFYAYQGTESKKMATSIQEELNTQLQIADPRMALDEPYQLLKVGGNMSVLIECGFFSNPEEEQKLQTDEYQDMIVEATVDGIANYIMQNEVQTQE